MVKKMLRLAVLGIGMFSMFGVGSARAAEIPMRGVVEGFYGTPWSMEERLDMIEFCKTHKMNAYIYAPKDDPYHREKWREPYPKKKLDELQTLIRASKSADVDFIFAVSPGLDIHFYGDARAADEEKMLAKLNAVYAIGGRHFAVFYDDIPEKDGKGQAEFLTRLEEKLRAEHPDIAPLITVPTEYFRLDMTADDKVNPYTKDFAAYLPKDTLVLYTGEGVASPWLSDAAYAAANDLYGRKLGLWINYPVNDYMEQKLALGPIVGLPTHSDIPAVFFNPMKYEQLSKIALATGADYARDTEHYRPERAWENAIKQQYGPLANAMRDFAEHSQHLENNWANIGRPDAPKFRQSWKSLLQEEKNPLLSKYARENVERFIKSMTDSAQKLKTELPEKERSDMLPQIEQMERITKAAETALNYLDVRKNNAKNAEQLKAQLQKEYDEIKEGEATAAISENTGVEFIRQVLNTK